MSAQAELIAIFAGLLFGLATLTAVEAAALEFLSIASRPKSILFPVLANIATLLAILIVAGVAVALVAFGLIVAMDSGYDSAEHMMMFAAVSPVLIPLAAFVVRFILFLLMKIGGAGRAALYAVVSAFISISGTALITGAVYFGASIAGLL